MPARAVDGHVMALKARDAIGIVAHHRSAARSATVSEPDNTRAMRQVNSVVSAIARIEAARTARPVSPRTNLPAQMPQATKGGWS